MSIARPRSLLKAAALLGHFFLPTLSGSLAHPYYRGAANAVGLPMVATNVRTRQHFVETLIKLS